VQIPAKEKRMKYRTDKDSLGELQVPAAAYYGIHTTRSAANFPISGYTVPAEQVRAMAYIKLACARANMDLGQLQKKKGAAIVKACREVIAGGLDGQFPVDIFSSGSGTSSNMNVNEVIASRAEELLGGARGAKKLVHPNDHVNMGQSTNNVFPSSIRVAALPKARALAVTIKKFAATLRRKARQFDKVIKPGRTHLQDAVPVRLGQVFAAFAYSMEKDAARLGEKLRFLRELGVGGNAVGTGINTHPKFRGLIIRHLNRETGEKFSVTPNGVEATHSTTDLADLSTALNTLAIDVHRICNDLRLLSSGPKTGLNEINLPPVEPGSSIMPGKVNPSVCEAVNMVCLKVFGNHQTVFMAAQAAQLELNTTMPVTGYALLESLRILDAGLRTLDETCVAGITANRKRCEWYAMQSPSLATFLNPVIGYDKASELAKQAVLEDKTIPEVALEKKILSSGQLKKVFDPKKLTSPTLGD